jgi:hypothetical protein
VYAERTYVLAAVELTMHIRQEQAPYYITQPSAVIFSLAGMTRASLFNRELFKADISTADAMHSSVRSEYRE